MKRNESIYQLTNTTLFYATAPLRYSFECFALKYSGEFFKAAFESFFKNMFKPESSLSEFIADCIIGFLFFPTFFTLALMLSIPVVITELVGGLLLIVPSIAIAISALPIVTLLALAESFCGLISNSFTDSVETQQEGLLPAGHPCP